MNFKSMGPDGGGKEASRATPPLSLARQLSVYSLTFDEFQSTLGGPGKDFGSMNMDEFLRNIWTAEESQAMASALGATAESGAIGGPGSSSGLQRQGSLTLPRTLSQKTVDEVWKDLLRESGSGQGGAGGGAGGTELPPQHRQPTLGEMTLEEFLVRAGVVREDMNQQPPAAAAPVLVQRSMIGNNSVSNNHGAANNSNINSGNSIFFGELPSSNNSNPGLALGFSQTAARNAGGVVHSQIPHNSAASLAMSACTTRPYPPPLQMVSNVDIGNQQGMRGGGIVGIGDPGLNNGLMSSVVGLGGGGGVTVAAVGSPDALGKGNGDLSSLSPVPYHVFGSGMRGRKCSGAVEKVVERRQRRMIKNRESAARSRARKQAYTMELEAEVAKLKEQNQELQKKQEEIMELQKNQDDTTCPSNQETVTPHSPRAGSIYNEATFRPEGTSVLAALILQVIQSSLCFEDVNFTQGNHDNISSLISTTIMQSNFPRVDNM